MKKRSSLTIYASLCLLLFTQISCSNTLVHLAKSYERGSAGLDEKSIQVGSHRIVYLEGGSGDNVLLLHGFGADKDNWTRFAKHLTGKYRVTAPDLPGFGDSDKIASAIYSYPEQVKRVHALASALGLKRFHLVGNSMGGYLAGLYDITYPGRVLSLTLIAPGGVKSPRPSAISREMEKGNNPLVISKAADFDRFLAFVFVTPPWIPGPLKEHFAERAVAARAFNEKIFLQVHNLSGLEESLGAVTARTLILWGDTDRVLDVSGAEVFHRKIKGSRVVIMKACGHAPMIERPEEAAGYFLEFIALK